MKLIPPRDLDLAVRAVEAGELVVLPTRRWYMICANARDSHACEQIFSAKGRPRSKSMAYVLPHLTDVDDLFVMTSHAHQLASAFWPGDLALILRWCDMTLGQQHEPVDVPNAIVTLDPGPLGELARRSRVPIAATTVNISHSTSTDAAGQELLASASQARGRHVSHAVTFAQALRPYKSNQRRWVPTSPSDRQPTLHAVVRKLGGGKR